MAGIEEIYRAAIMAHRGGRAEQAGRLYDAVLAQQPDHAGALHLKGVMALQRHDYAAAAGLIERSVALDPTQVGALCNLGVVYGGLKRFGESVAVLTRAVELDPNLAEGWANLSRAQRRAGQIEESIESARRVLTLDPRAGMKHWITFAENYLAGSDPIAMAQRARELGRKLEAEVEPARVHSNDPDPLRPLRVGLVSGDLRNHPVGRFLRAVIPAVDSGRLRFVAYSTAESEDDDTTVRLRQAVPEWRHVLELDDEALARQIVEDRIDILVDLSGHTKGNRLGVFARKPAPVSFTWIGYFATTGLSRIDYVLANRWVIPESERDQWVETPWRLPETYLCFSEPNESVEVGPLPAASSPTVTFGCFNNFNKHSDETLRAWAGLLQSVPGSRLVVRSSSAYHDDAIEAVEGRMRAAGIDLARVRMDTKIADYAAHLRAYNEIDIALDTFPYNGGTTTVEALYMGVPVLVRAGDRYVAHMGESILHNAGLSDWIAPDAAAYVALGARMAADRTALARLREGLRQRMLASPLFDAPRFARHFEDALQGMWQAWCATQGRG